MTVAVTFAQLRHRETELEWHKTQLGGKHVNVLVPVGWKEADGGGGRGGAWIEIRPSHHLVWVPEIIRTFIVDEQGPKESMIVSFDVSEPIFKWREISYSEFGKEAVYFVATKRLPTVPYIGVYYRRANKRAWDATHKRICESVQLVP